jgi:hypothetical protein
MIRTFGFTGSGRRLVRLVTALALAVTAPLLQARMSHAGPVDVLLAPWTCGGRASLDITKTSAGYSWSISGVGGTCSPQLYNGDASTLSFSFSGTSATLGLCDGSKVVRDLDLQGTASGDVYNIDEVTGGSGPPDPFLGPWSKTLHFHMNTTTFPVKTSFWVLDNTGNSIGNGSIDSHVFAMCPPAGSKAATINWSQPSPI